MQINEMSRDKVAAALEKAQQGDAEVNGNIRLLFVPHKITEGNLRQTCDVYSRLDTSQYNTVVVLEDHHQELDKKLTMPGKEIFETPFGKVPANESLRDTFCDEDDDFFINDEAFHPEMALFGQLMMLQMVLDDFDVVSIQIASRGPAIIKELVYVLEDVLGGQNALIICASELPGHRTEQFDYLRKQVENRHISSLFNFLNSGASQIQGTGSFIAGIHVCHLWNLEIHLAGAGEAINTEENLLSGYGDLRPTGFFNKF